MHSVLYQQGETRMMKKTLPAFGTNKGRADRKERIKKLFLVPVLLIGLTACAGNVDTNRYETSAAGRVNSASLGEVINVRAVTIATSNGTVGKLAGGVAGGVAGSMIGGNSAVHAIGAVGGAVLGGYLGDKAQENLSRQKGYEYVVRLENGNVVTVTQGADEVFRVGQKVYVLDAGAGDRARIIPQS
jgi:outer membrane lipoprotein SlyB